MRNSTYQEIGESTLSWWKLKARIRSRKELSTLLLPIVASRVPSSVSPDTWKTCLSQPLTVMGVVSMAYLTSSTRRHLIVVGEHGHRIEPQAGLQNQRYWPW